MVENSKTKVMIYLINYLRQAFCKHEFVYEENYCESSDDMGGYRNGYKVNRTCKKCGWYKRYWKF
jgi:RNase P subunit RPR2